MNLAIKCRKCGQWSSMTTQNINKALFSCKRCPHKGKLRDARLNWNYNLLNVSPAVDMSKLIQTLNEKEALKENSFI